MTVVLRPGALRLALATVVVAAHVHWLESPADGVAVAGFFMLSGYWVTVLWDARYSRCMGPLLTFYISRAWRIYPLAAAGTICALFTIGGSWSALPRNLLLLPTANDPWPIDPPLWSLIVEAQFYLIAPGLFAIMPRRGWAVAIMTASFAAWVPFLAGAGKIYATYMPIWLWLFAVGVTYARSPQPKWAGRLAPWSLAVTIILCLSTTLQIVPLEQSIVRTLMLLASVAFAPYVAASVAQNSSKRDQGIGDLAFPLYVVHTPVMMVAKTAGLPIVAQLLAALAATIVLWLLDRPVEWARHRFVEARRFRPPKYPEPPQSRPRESPPTPAQGQSNLV